MGNTATTLKINQDEAIAQLTALGYKPSDMVYFRFFYPKEDPRSETDQGRKLEFRSDSIRWEALERYQRDGRGTYFVVNGGGHKDKDVSQCRAIFTEHDEIGKEESKVLWQALGLPEPSFQVDTGGKSIHTFWVLEEPISVEQWRELQTDLLEFTDGDRKIKNPSRVMRLAGAFHIKPGRDPIQSTIVSNSGNRYSFEELRAAVPAKDGEPKSVKAPAPREKTTKGHKAWEDFKANFRLPIPESVPLEVCLSRKNRALIESGVGEGERNCEGTALAFDLLGTAAYLDSVGQCYDGDPRSLLEDYAARCSPPLPGGEVETIWKSANSKAPSAALSPEKIEGCIRGWAWRERKATKALQRRSPGGSESEFESIRGPRDEKIAFGNFCQRALTALYTHDDTDKPWVCISGQLYQWQGTHYELSSDEVEYRRVFEYADNYQVLNKHGFPEYPFASPHHVEQAIKWVKLGLTVDPRKVNPPGLNCTNGVLTVEWQGDRPSVKLQPHSPDHIFIYAPVATYDPNTNSEACDRMLAALEPGQRDVFLKVAAASLDLGTVRKYRGRLIRALLMMGSGSNGKDTLRECLTAIYGYQSVTGCTLSDFEAYDQGRKFSLSRLKDSRLNWASENGNATKLDRLQSLKAFITGDTLDCERKGQDIEEFTPKAIALFNINDIPQLEAFQEAIKSRYAVVSFDKTFKMGADPSKGEIEADPRFKYDHDFLRSEVLPAFLNKLVDALQRLMTEGIDYTCTDGALTEIQRSSSHLFQFAEDVGLGYGEPSDRLYAGEIWKLLKSWYLANGTLTIEVSDRGKEKLVWVEQSNPRDRNVKAPNQIIPRILQLFPKAKRGTENDPKGIYVTGLTLKLQNQFEAKAEPVTQSQSDFEAIEPISAIAAQVEQLLSGLSVEQRRQLLNQIGDGQIGSIAQNHRHESDTASSVGSELVQQVQDDDTAGEEEYLDDPETEGVDPVVDPVDEPLTRTTSLKKGDRVMTPRGVGEVNYSTDIDGVAAVYVNGETWVQPFPPHELTAIAS